jgi:hypothetical protein
MAAGLSLTCLRSDVPRPGGDRRNPIVPNGSAAAMYRDCPLRKLLLEEQRVLRLRYYRLGRGLGGA